MTFEPRKPRPNMWGDVELSPKEHSQRTEKRVAKLLGWRTTPGSGNQALPSKKGDISHPRFLAECKETKKSSIRVGADVVDKIFREASAVGKDAVLILTVGGLPDNLPKDWVCLPLEVFQSLLKEVYGE
jgi:hypothetical protein